MKLLHGNLHLLSEQNFMILVKHYEGYILTSKEQSSLLSDLIKHRATSLEPLSPD
jgi:hypothetical protein